MRWRGQALQVIVGNTRRYGDFAEATPDALIDDGALDVCIITGESPFSSIEQILSILFHRNPHKGRCERFRDSHFRIRAPASIDLQLDGSRVKLDDVPTPDETARGEKKGADALMVTYSFDAISRALHVAIPCTYNGELFENRSAKKTARPAKEQGPDQDAVQADAPKSKDIRRQSKPNGLLDHGRKVTVVGVAPNPERDSTYIVAGMISDKGTAASTKPVAVRIDHDTTLIGRNGEPLAITVAAKLPENAVIIVEGK